MYHFMKNRFNYSRSRLFLKLIFKHLSKKKSTFIIHDRYLSFRSRCPQHQFKIIQRTGEFLVKFYVAVLRQVVRLITLSTMKPTWLCLNELHKPSAFPTPVEEFKKHITVVWQTHS